MLLYYLPVVLIVMTYGLYFYFTRSFNYWKKRNVPGPEPIALCGNLKEFTFRRKNLGVVLQEYYNSFPEEKVIGIYRMTTPSLLIRDLDIIKQVMIKDFDVFNDRGIYLNDNVLKQNMFHADGQTWGALRPLFSPIFTSGKLNGMFHLLRDCADNLNTYLNDIGPTNTALDITALTRKYTVSSISACAFGVNLNNFYNEADDTLLKLDKLVLTPSYALEIDMMYPGLPQKLEFLIGLEDVTRFFQGLVDNIVSQRKGKPSRRGDFMDLILQVREMGEIKNSKTNEGTETQLVKVTDEMIAAQAFVFYVGGYETSSTTMSYMLYQLALNPEIQDKLREEIDAVTKAHGVAQGEITYESLKDMKYLEKIFLETLRMYPIVDPLQRKAKADYKIPGTDIVIKKDQIVLVSTLGIHYDKNYYPKPEVFDPDRFDPEIAGPRHPCAYLPFGTGPRNCIGMRFGSLQSRLGVAKLISKFQVLPTENTKPSITFNPNRVILGPLENIYLKIRPRIF